MNKIRITLLVLGFLLLAAACRGGDNDSVSAGADDPTDDDPFGQTEWILVEGVVDGDQLELLARYPVTLQRDGNDVDGSAACNNYFGTIINGETLFDGFGATEMACDPAPMTLESDYLNALGRVTTAESGPTSLMLSAAGVELVFERVEPIPDGDLEGTTWLLDTLIEGDAATSTVNGTRATLNFDAAVISGTDGCNTFQGEYEINDETLEVGLLSLTTRGCEDGVMSQAQLVGEVLAAGPSIEIDGDRLILSASNTLGLIYRVSSTR